ncbi:MAG: hypothetical protein IPP69_13445 [Flavobacteriales bacterium]|nr:hypothetical protein [Flavobacteriales bacterium]
MEICTAHYENLTGIKTYPFVLKSKERDLQVDAYFISIANSNQFGNHFTIAPKASIQDGLLDIVAVEKKNLFTVLIKYSGIYVLERLQQTSRKVEELLISKQQI